ncbi:MAG: SpoIID/LytB domain-containing protein [Candidatus Gastranaerophilales bacterium]|nr:SpoIID/LytB domain-containing protein [Candidatus Gastranaerophilales bacterium]
MKHKTLIFLVLIQIMFICLTVFSGNNMSSLKAQSSGIDENMNLIKVGISTNDFSQLEYNQVSITSKGPFEIINKRDNTLLAISNGNEVFTFKVIDDDINIYKDKTQVAEYLFGPIGIIPQGTNPLEIVGLKRAGKSALYKGEIEIVKSPVKDDKLSVVNILPLEEYLKGVVPNEMPSKFGLEALKAQAVAARNYAIKPRVKSYSQFDICDSVACQVYFGCNTETPKANQAIDETKGLVGIYNDELILALYSSTAGGYTESYENAFTETGSKSFPSSPKPYLKGKPDIDGTPILDNEENARSFYTATPASYEADSGYFRWTRYWSEPELEVLLNKNLSKYNPSGFVSPYFSKNMTTGAIKKIEVLERGVSGKAMIVRIAAANGIWTVKKELIIRKIFENSGKMMPSANVVFDNVTDSNGNLEKVVAYGGGLGHGVGMSQFGASYMSKNNYTFDQILQHYYDKISIGTSPIKLTASPVSEAVCQQYYTNNGKSELVIDNSQRLNSLKILINSNEVNIPLKNYDQDKIRIDLQNYVKEGVNDIIYFPPKGDEDGKSIKAWIEVYTPN